VGPNTVVTNLADLLGEREDGVHWTLPGPSDLNANLVHLAPGSSMAEHVNREVDVLLVVVAGAGTLRVDGNGVTLDSLTVAHVPKGSTRALVAGDAGLSYLTVHRRRGPLQVQQRH
jgi:quercetin dioxygenase-like cupin family protein